VTNFEKIIQNMTVEDYAADRAFHQVCHDERGCPVERIEKGFINVRGRFTLPCFDCWKDYLKSEVVE